MEPIKAATIIICILGVGYTSLCLWFEHRQEKKRKDFRKRVTNFNTNNYETKSETKSN